MPRAPGHEIAVAPPDDNESTIRQRGHLRIRLITVGDQIDLKLVPAPRQLCPGDRRPNRRQDEHGEGGDQRRR